MAKMQVFTYDNLALYDGLLKGRMSAEDAKSIKTVAIDGNTLKFYKVEEPVGSTEPAYTITLPSADLSGLIPKITGATANNIVTANADGTVKDSGVAVADLAIKAEVKTVQDAVDILNGSDTVDGSVAKSIKDLKTTLDADIATAKASGDNAQADVNALAEKVGTVPEDKTVVQMIQDAQTAATYDDTEVRSLIQDNADAIEAHKTAVDAKVTTLVGDDANKSVRTIAAEETAKIVASAPEDFDTLKEIADWIEADKTRAAELTTKVSNNEKAIADEVTRATGVESGLDTRLSAVETLVGEGGSVDEKIATAKQEAIDAAATDATTKANTAETNAKAAVTALENGAVKTNADNIASLQSLVGEGVEAIPEASIRALFA